MAYFCSINTSTFSASGAINQPAWEGSGDANWSIEWDVAITNLASTRFLAGVGSGTRSIAINPNGSIQVFNVGAINTSAAGTITVNTRYTIKLESVGTTKNLYVKLASDPSYGAAVCTGTDNNLYRYWYIGRVSATYGRCFDVYGLTTVEGTYNETWDGTNAPSTGTTWTGANGGVLSLVNTQGTADAWWVFYDAGGAIDADIAITMPQLTVAASAGVVAPSIGAAIAFTMPQFALDASVADIAPIYNASAAFAMPQFALSAALIDTAPEFTASAAFAMPQFSLAAALSDTDTPLTTGAVSFTMPSFTVASVASVINPDKPLIGFWLSDKGIAGYRRGFNNY